VKIDATRKLRQSNEHIHTHIRHTNGWTRKRDQKLRSPRRSDVATISHTRRETFGPAEYLSLVVYWRELTIPNLHCQLWPASGQTQIITIVPAAEKAPRHVGPIIHTTLMACCVTPATKTQVRVILVSSHLHFRLSIEPQSIRIPICEFEKRLNSTACQGGSQRPTVRHLRFGQEVRRPNSLSSK
jgi:hypothetical protein